MLDRDIDPDNYDECPSCGAMLLTKGDKWEGTVTCSDKCGFTDSWDNIPDEPERFDPDDHDYND